MTTKLTANAGASRTRASIKRKLQSLRDKVMFRSINTEREFDDLLKFIDGQAERASAKKGGLGRK